MKIQRLGTTTDSIEGYAAIAAQRTTHGRHVAICHAAGQSWQLLHLRFHHDLANESFAGNFAIVNLGLDDETTRDLAGFCRRIADASPQIPYAVRFCDDVGFHLVTGDLSDHYGMGFGQNCSTFVLIVFRSFGIPLIDIDTWQERLSDLQDHLSLVKVMRKHEGTGPHSIATEHVAAVEQNVGCVRVRPEEVAGACLYDDLPVQFQRALPAGEKVLEFYDAAFS